MSPASCIENMKSPFATDIEFTGVLYEHVPNAAVSGFDVQNTSESSH